MKRNVVWHLRFSQQARWTADLRRYVFSQISNVHDLLEVGCGTGAVLSDLPDFDAPGSPVRLTGLDLDPDFLQTASAGLPGARFVLGDAHILPFSTSSFDLAFTHYLLLWVKNPLGALQECRRVVRPGGWVAAFAEPDYGGRIDYPAGLTILGEAQEKSLQRQGAEPRLGRQLKALFHQAGFKEIECGVIGAQWQSQPTSQELDLEWEVALMDVQDDFSQAEISAFRELYFGPNNDAENILFVPTFYAFGQV